MFIQVIWEAMRKFKEEDSDLLAEKELIEVCIGHRIALYIQEIILNSTYTEIKDLRSKVESGYAKIDIEYDKELYDKKIMDSEGARPDILIHHRREHVYNYALIELKKRKRDDRDIAKCISAKKDPYNYTHALTIDYLVNDLEKIRVIERVDDDNEIMHPYPWAN